MIITLRVKKLNFALQASQAILSYYKNNKIIKLKLKI